MIAPMLLFSSQATNGLTCLLYCFCQTSAPATGEDLFKSDPFGAASSASPLPPSSLPQTSTMTDPSPARAVDPFSGQDPFNSDPFSSNDKQVRVHSLCYGVGHL